MRLLAGLATAFGVSGCVFAAAGAAAQTAPGAFEPGAAQLMGAASAGLPAIQLITGSMLTGSHRGEVVGACTDCRRYWAKFRAEQIDGQEIADVNDQLVPSVGTCSVMGTSTFTFCASCQAAFAVR